MSFNNNGLGNKIKNHLTKNGIKQSFVAEKAKISNTHLSNVLNDRVAITNLVLNDINNALGTKFKFED